MLNIRVEITQSFKMFQSLHRICTLQKHRQNAVNLFHSHKNRDMKRFRENVFGSDP